MCRLLTSPTDRLVFSAPAGLQPVLFKTQELSCRLLIFNNVCSQKHTHIITDVLTTELDKPMGQVVTPLTPVNISPDKRERSGKVLLKG